MKKIRIPVNVYVEWDEKYGPTRKKVKSNIVKRITAFQYPYGMKVVKAKIRVTHKKTR